VVAISPHRPVKGPEWGGTHRKSGVFIAKGKSLNRGIRVSGARLIDLAPTLLYLMGQKVPDDIDGRVLTEILDPEFLQQQAAQYTTSSETTSGESEGKSYTAEEAAQIEARLKALGYID
jgi:arylsulfatase A-like enzyme